MTFFERNNMHAEVRGKGSGCIIYPNNRTDNQHLLINLIICWVKRFFRICNNRVHRFI